MTTTRVWLSSWEWDCCGDAFASGARVTLNVSREVDPWVQEMLGPELAHGIAAVESHHDEPGPEQLTGVVTAIHGVTIDHSERREPRTHHQPPERLSLGNGFWATAGSREPYVTIFEPIPGTGRLHPAPRVPWPPRDESTVIPPPPRALSGYFVDVETD